LFCVARAQTKLPERDRRAICRRRFRLPPPDVALLPVLAPPPLPSPVVADETRNSSPLRDAPSQRKLREFVRQIRCPENLSTRSSKYNLNLIRETPRSLHPPQFLAGLFVLHRGLYLDLAHFRYQRQYFDIYRRAHRSSARCPVLRYASPASFHYSPAGVAPARTALYAGANVARE